MRFRKLSWSVFPICHATEGLDDKSRLTKSRYPHLGCESSPYELSTIQSDLDWALALGKQNGALEASAVKGASVVNVIRLLQARRIASAYRARTT